MTLGDQRYLSTVVVENAKKNSGRVREIQMHVQCGDLSVEEGRERIKKLLIENARIMEPGSEEERFLNGLL